MAKTLKIAAAQMKVDDDVDVNLRTILMFLEKARKEKIDIICFPETCLSSYQDKVIEVEKQIKEIQNKCKEQGIWCILGTYVPHEGKNRNVSFVINNEGKIVYEYDKVHLWKSEKKYVIGGQTNEIVDTNFGKIGVITCWDFAYPGFIKKLSQQGAKIIFCPSFLVNSKRLGLFLRIIPRIRAFENKAYFVMCDAFLPTTHSGSYIAAPDKLLGSIHGRQGMIVAELDLDNIPQVKMYKFICMPLSWVFNGLLSVFRSIIWVIDSIMIK